MTAVRITIEERDALYSQILDHLSGIDGVHHAIAAEDFATAERLGREYADELRLVEQLGWGCPPAGDGVELTMPAEQLHRLFVRLRHDVDALREHEAREAAEAEEEAREFRERSQRIAEVSDRVLAIVGRTPPADGD